MTLLCFTVLHSSTGANPARYFGFELQAVVEKLGLDHESVEAPPSLDRRGVDTWIIIGRNHSIVTTIA